MSAPTAANTSLSFRRRAVPARSLALLLGLFLFGLSARAEQARGVILPAVTLDGPNQNIAGFGGVAMAEDGTGGLVYLKRVDGVAHVFVSRYLGGHWLAPIRVDTEQPYAASWPRIGAADGGELVVVWVTPFATNAKGRTVDELIGATLGPGASGFGPGIIVGSDIGEGVGASPDLAMSSTGQADVVYRAIEENPSVPLLRPGDVVEQVRVAHYDGQRWTDLGAVNRDRGLSMRAPTAANAPQIAIGPTGNGVVVWQEPDIEGVARIWARRIFGENLDYVLPVTAMSFAGSPIGEDAEAPSVALSLLGQAEVAYRQPAGPGSPLPGARIFLNTLPDGESMSGAEFLGASVVDNQVPGGKTASVGRPSIDIDERLDMRLLYDDDGTPRVIEGNDRGLSGALTLGPGVVGSELAAADESPVASVMNPEGGGVSAWPSANPQGSPEVAIREDFPDGAVQTALVDGGAGGPISELGVGRSGLGDGLVAFQQGPIGDAAIIATQVTAPPAQFVLTVPNGWVKPAAALVSWEPASSANGPLTYTVVLDGHREPTPAGVHELHLNPHGLASGSNEVQVLATDIYGQSLLSSPSTIHVDGVAPSVQVTRTEAGHAVRVRVTDRYSGVDASAITVSFGDGQSARGRARFIHRYARAGIYTVTVHVRDKLGNQAVVRRVVSVS